jgi:hypothetical protein
LTNHPPQSRLAVRYSRLSRALGLYALLTVALTWPLAARLRITGPGDTSFFAWVMAWETHALATRPAMLPHANIFHPYRYTLGLDEPILGTTVLALPISAFTDDAVLVFNIVRLLTFFLTGLATYLLARDLGCDEAPALFAGAAFAFSPIRTDQIAHLSTLGTQWLPLVLLFAFRFFRTGLVRHALLAALFFAMAAYACGYHGVIGLMVLPIALVPLLWGRWGRLPTALLAATAAGLALLPLYRLQSAALRQVGFARGREETILYAAALQSFLATSSSNRVYGELTAPFRLHGPNNLFPGLVIPAIVLGGALWLRRRKAAPGREAMALALMGAAAILIALGPEVHWMGRTLFPGPFGFAREVIPLLRMIRVTSRAGMYLALALSVLAALALARGRVRPRWVAALGGLALAEAAIVPVTFPAWTDVVDSRRPAPAVYSWLAAQPGEDAIVELPIMEDDGLFRRPACDESVYMVRSTLHWKRLVNGWAGGEPEGHKTARTLARRFPSEESVSAFRGLGVRYVVLHGSCLGPNQAARMERDLPTFRSSLREVARFGPDTIFELMASPAAE